MSVEEEKHLDLGWYGGVVDERKKVGKPDTSNKAGEAQLKQEVFIQDTKDRFVESLRSLIVVEGHLTYPENGELCDCKEPGNPRHDVAKPE